MIRRTMFHIGAAAASRCATAGGITKSRLAAAAALIGLALSALPAQASHFRYTHITWTPVAGMANTAEIVVTSAFRRDGFPGSAPDGFAAVGDIFTEAIGGTALFFGDGVVTPTLEYRAIAIDVSANFVVGRALSPGTTTENLTHAYPTATNAGKPWIAAIDSSDRIGALRNCPSCPYRVETAVRFDIANSSPVSGLPPIINVPINTNFSFPVPALDAESDALNWRLSTPQESHISDPIGPEGIADADHAPTIDPATGLLSWNTTGNTAVGDLFCIQVTIEESRAVKAAIIDVQKAVPADGDPTPLASRGFSSIIGKSAVDFILRIVPQGDPPTCQISPSGPFTVAAGHLLTFAVSGVPANPANTVELNTAGLPPGAAMTPPLPASAASPGVSSTFNWTPTPGQEGVYSVNYTVTEAKGLQSVCNAQITVCPDADRDGVCDSGDACPATPAGQATDAAGCSCSQHDGDADGVNDCDDQCPDTPAGIGVNVAGCVPAPIEETPPPGLPGCDPRGWALNILFSLIFKAPVCGLGCPAAVIGTMSGLTLMRVGRRRRR